MEKCEGCEFCFNYTCECIDSVFIGTNIGSIVDGTCSHYKELKPIEIIEDEPLRPIKRIRKLLHLETRVEKEIVELVEALEKTYDVYIDRESYDIYVSEKENK